MLKLTDFSTVMTGHYLNTDEERDFLIPNCPDSIVMISLVKDAIASLPNGNGKIIDIYTELIKSQYIRRSVNFNELKPTILKCAEVLRTGNNPWVRYKRGKYFALHPNPNPMSETSEKTGFRVLAIILIILILLISCSHRSK